MKTGMVTLAIGFGILAATGLSYVRAIASETAVYTFQVKDGSGSMSYRCAVAATLANSETNARAAHALFEPAVQTAARLQAKAMVASMSPDRVSSDVVADLDSINAEADALRGETHREMQRRFGCNYIGST